MRSMNWPMFGAVAIGTAVLILVTQGQGFGAPQILLALVAALATCVGAALAPASYQSVPDPQRRARKTRQVLAAGAVTVLAVALLRQHAGTAAVCGIVAALLVGAVLPRKDDARVHAPDADRADRIDDVHPADDAHLTDVPSARGDRRGAVGG